MALAFVGLNSSFMFTLVVPLQAELPNLLQTTRENTTWVVTITLLVGAVVTPIAGRLGDMYGKRRVLITLIVILVIGSLIAGFSASVVGVIIGRGFQGAGMGSIPLGIAIMRDVLPPERLSTAVALMSATMGVGGAVGMPLAAYVAQTTSFVGLFWLSAGLGVCAALLVWVFVPVDVMRYPGRLDLIGAFGFALGMSALLLLLSRGAEWGWSSPIAIATGAGGLVVLALWAWYQLRVRDPLINLRIASRPAVLFTNVAGLCMGFALFSSNVTFPQMLEISPDSGYGFGLSMLQAALVIMPSGLLMMLIAPLSGKLERTIGARPLFTIGTFAIVLAYVFILIWASEWWHVLISNIIIGVGIGFTFAAMPMIIMGAVPVRETGVSNGLNALFRSVGTATASAVMGGVLASMSVVHEGSVVPTRDAFVVCFVLAVIVGVVAVILSLLIPKQPIEQRPAVRPHPASEGDGE